MKQLKDFAFGVVFACGLTILSFLWIATLGDYELLRWIFQNIDRYDYFFTFTGVGLGFALGRELIRRHRARH
jgi:hypothetical protein